MALSSATLEQGLLPIFKSPPTSLPDLADAWANALFSYASSVTPPANPAILEAAKAGVTAQLLAGFTAIATVVPSLEAALVLLATATGAAMAPLFVGTPPPAPPGIMALLVLFPPTAEAAAAGWAAHIDAWFKTGSAVQSVSGSVTTWL